MGTGRISEGPSLEARKSSYREAQLNGDKEEEAKWANQIGHAFKDRGEYVKALEWFKRDFNYSSKARSSEPAKLMPTLLSLGEIYLRLERYDDALANQREHLKLAEQLGDVIEQQRSNTQLGRTYMEIYEKEDKLSALADANAFLNKSLDLAQRLRNCPPVGKSSSTYVLELADAYNNLGLARSLGEDHDKAREFYEEGLKVCNDEEIGDDDAARSRLHHNLGRIYCVFRDFDRARTNIEKDILICKRIPHRQGEAKGLNNLGDLFFKQGKYDEASRYFSRALKVAQSLQDEDTLCSLVKSNMNMVEKAKVMAKAFDDGRRDTNRLERESEAVKGTLRERECLKREYRLLTELAGKAEELQFWEEHRGLAKRLIKVCIKLEDTEKEGDGLELLASSYDNLRKFEKAIKWHRKAFEKFRSIRHLQGQIIAKINLANSLDGIGRLEEALKTYQDALRAATSDDSRDLVDLRLNALNNMQLICLVKLDRVDEAKKIEQQLKQLKREFRLSGKRKGEGRCSETGSESDGDSARCDNSSDSDEILLPLSYQARCKPSQLESDKTTKRMNRGQALERGLKRGEEELSNSSGERCHGEEAMEPSVRQSQRRRLRNFKYREESDEDNSSAIDVRQKNRRKSLFDESTIALDSDSDCEVLLADAVEIKGKKRIRLSKHQEKRDHCSSVKQDKQSSSQARKGKLQKKHKLIESSPESLSFPGVSQTQPWDENGELPLWNDDVVLSPDVRFSSPVNRISENAVQGCQGAPSATRPASLETTNSVEDKLPLWNDDRVFSPDARSPSRINRISETAIQACEGAPSANRSASLETSGLGKNKLPLCNDDGALSPDARSPSRLNRISETAVQGCEGAPSGTCPASLETSGLGKNKLPLWNDDGLLSPDVRSSSRINVISENAVQGCERAPSAIRPASLKTSNLGTTYEAADSSLHAIELPGAFSQSESNHSAEKANGLSSIATPTSQDARLHGQISSGKISVLTASYLTNCKRDSGCSPNLAVVERLRSQKVSEEIIVAGCNIQDDDAVPLLAALKGSEAFSILDLSHNSLGNATVNGIQDLIKSTNQSDLGLTVDLHSNNLGAGALMQICKCPVSISRIEILNLANNRLTDAVARNLSAILKESEALAALNLESCALTTRSIKQLAGALRSDSSLTKLCIGRNNPIAGFAIEELLGKLSKLTSFSELDLTGIEMDDHGVVCIGSLLQKSTSLSVLVLQDVNIQNDGALALANALENCSPRLSRLDLSFNSFKAKPAADLYSQVLSLHSLSILNLSGNEIDQEAAQWIGQRLANSSCRLKTLYLSKCSLGPSGILLILRSLQEQTSLLDLNLSDNLRTIGIRSSTQSDVCISECEIGNESHAGVPTALELNCGTDPNDMREEDAKAAEESRHSGMLSPSTGREEAGLNWITGSQSILLRTRVCLDQFLSQKSCDIDLHRAADVHVADGSRRQINPEDIALGAAQPEVCLGGLGTKDCSSKDAHLQDANFVDGSKLNCQPVQVCLQNLEETSGIELNMQNLPADKSWVQNLARAVLKANGLRRLDLSGNGMKGDDIDMILHAWSFGRPVHSLDGENSRHHSDEHKLHFFADGWACCRGTQCCDSARL